MVDYILIYQSHASGSTAGVILQSDVKFTWVDVPVIWIEFINGCWRIGHIGRLGRLGRVILRRRRARRCRGSKRGSRSASGRFGVSSSSENVRRKGRRELVVRCVERRSKCGG